MPDTGETTDSVSTPIEAYRASLRRGKKQAEEARKAAEALNTLEETIPQWWQMFELTKREVPYRPIQTWQEQAREVLESAQSDFLSGNISRTRSGGNKILKVKSGLEDKEDEMEEEYKTKNNKVESMSKKIDREKEKINESKKDVETKKKELTYSAVGYFLYGAFAAFIYWFVAGILISILGFIFGFTIEDAAIPFVVTILAVWFVVSYSHYSSAKEESGVEDISRGIKSKKEKLEEIKLERSETVDELDKIEETYNKINKIKVVGE